MAANGHHQNGGRTILVLYRITNSESDSSDPLFNCFQMPYGRGPTLNAVKQHCTAAHSLSHLGPEGYHWRVLVEDKPVAGSTERAYSWWDVQDGNAKLPVKETTQYNLRKLLFPPKPSLAATDTAAKAAKGAFKMMNKMVTGDDAGGSDHGPPVAVLTFKLLDLMKAADDVNKRNGGTAPIPPTHAATTTTTRHHHQPRAAPAPAPPRAAAPTPRQQPRAAPQHVRQSAPPRAYQAPQQTRVQPPPQQQQRKPAEADLMGFNSPGRNPKVLHHAMSAPLPAMTPTGRPAHNPNETRAQKLQREHKQREKTAAKNRVWDPVDERWVEMQPGSAPPGHAKSGIAATAKTTKVKGVSLNRASAYGKSETVQRGVEQRVAEMEKEQAKKVNELREREAKKKKDEEEEDVIRRRLDPKIKAWAEEHGKKKQLRALLASLHTVLWPGAKWKQLTIGDLLDDSKVKRAFHKASLVVHPDKTSDLPPEQRFLAKRIFDGLCQAKSDFDDGAK